MPGIKDKSHSTPATPAPADIAPPPVSPLPVQWADFEDDLAELGRVDAASRAAAGTVVNDHAGQRALGESGKRNSAFATAILNRVRDRLGTLTQFRTEQKQKAADALKQWRVPEQAAADEDKSRRLSAQLQAEEMSANEAREKATAFETEAVAAEKALAETRKRLNLPDDKAVSAARAEAAKLLAAIDAIHARLADLAIAEDQLRTARVRVREIQGTLVRWSAQLAATRKMAAPVQTDIEARTAVRAIARKAHDIAVETDAEADRLQTRVEQEIRRLTHHDFVTPRTTDPATFVQGAT